MCYNAIVIRAFIVAFLLGATTGSAAVVGFTAPRFHVLETAPLAYVWVERSDGAGTLTVEWKAWDVVPFTATRHRGPYSGTLVFAPGEVKKAIDVELVDDDVYFQSVVGFALVSADHATLSLDRQSCFLAIDDDDRAPIVSYENPGPVLIKENRPGVNLRLSEPSTIPVVVYSYVDWPGHGWGFNPVRIETFPFGSSYPVAVFPPGDTHAVLQLEAEDDELWWFGDFDSWVDLWAEGAVIDPASQRRDLFVIDDEPRPTLSISDVTLKENDEGSTTAHLKIKLDMHGLVIWNPPNVTIEIAADAEDVTVGPRGFWNGDEIDVPVTIHGDRVVEADETFTVTIGRDAEWSEYLFPEIVKPTGRITILNDDAEIAPSPVLVTCGTAMPVTIDIGSPLDYDAHVPLASTGDALQVPADVVIPAGRSRVAFELRAATAPAAAAIRVGIPDSRSGAQTIEALAVQPSRVVFEAAPLAARSSGVLRVRIEPAASTPVTLILANSNENVLRVPRTITIPPGGEAMAAVDALRAGTATISTKLPIEYGGAEVRAELQVVEPRRRSAAH